MVSTLNIGHSFSNAAAIYFDYNDPIATNNEVIMIEHQVSIPSFGQSQRITIYPNPVEHRLNIKSQLNLKFNSIEIYSISGQVPMVVTNADTAKSVDVSHLKSGYYILKNNTDKSASTDKFLKKQLFTIAYFE